MKHDPARTVGRWAGMLLVLCGLFPGGVMAFSARAVVFSAVEGVITLDGQPVVGAEVIRRYEHRGLQVATVISDHAGGFAFPEVRRWHAAVFLPMEFVIPQQLEVRYQGKHWSIWSGTKRSPKANSELNGLPLRLACELTDDEQVYRQFGAILVTRCASVRRLLE
mgnify:CR=1 FL=1